MKAKKCVLVSVLVAILAVAVIGVGQEKIPCTVHVQPGESIQQAIDTAPEGAVICLEEGEWAENITIGKALTLRGAGAEHSVIRGNEESALVEINSPDKIQVIVEKVRIAGVYAQTWYGISANGNVQATITDCNISYNYYGILLSEFARAAITDCTISTNIDNGVGLFESAQATITNSSISDTIIIGVELGDSAQATITDCTISTTGDNGIALSGSAQATISNSSISDNDGGIELGDSAQATITNSNIYNNEEDGINLINSAQATITNNNIYNNGEDGIGLHHSAQATITDCKVFDNCESIFLVNSAHATITECTISHNRYGIWLWNSAQAKLEGNDITKNEHYGVVLYDLLCFDIGELFTGYVTGKNNNIPGRYDPNGNTAGAFCPNELSFLTTEQGGDLDRREQQ